ncbi:MAG: hypothetical protein NTY02_10225 [Acidobacteria bacterium]|nr:hypothetical protein [Acidobacteriota bacterium]
MLTRRVLILAIVAVALTSGSVNVPLVEALQAQKHCKFDRECNDGNPCTADTCSSGTCTNKPDDGASQSCYRDGDGTPLGGTAGVGNCRAGTQRCSGGSFGPCTGAVGASSESCGNGDENCNGQTDEEGSAGCTTFYKYKHCTEAGCSKCLCKAEYPYVVKGGVPDSSQAQARPLDWLYRPVR